MTETTSSHVAVLAFPFASHAGLLFNLLCRLATASPNVTFSFFSTKKSNNALFSTNIHRNIKPYDVPSGLPEGLVPSRDPLEEINYFLKVAEEGFREGMAAAEAGLRIGCVFADAFLWFSATLAEERGAKWVPLWTSAACSLSTHFYTDLIRDTVGTTGEIMLQHSKMILYEINKHRVRDYISSKVDHLTAFVVDMFCTESMDLANEFNVPTYVYFTSSAGFLGLIFHLQILEDEYNQDISKFKDSDAELSVLGFSNSVPARVLPPVIFDKEYSYPNFLDIPRRLRKVKGILLNTFTELESNTIKSLSDENNIPKIYPVGP